MLVVGDVLARAAGRLNDATQSTYTNAVLLPHIADAWDELKLELDLNGHLSIKNKTSPIIVAIGVTSFKSVGILPDDLLEPSKLEERLSGSVDLFIPMTKRQWEPNLIQTDSLRYWAFRKGDIITPGANSARDVQIYYTTALLDLTDDDENLDAVRQCKPFLINRTAALAARFIGNNTQRADALDTMAQMAKDILIRINAKAKQGTRMRRRPFRVMGRRNWA